MPSTFERLEAILVRDYKVDPARLTPEASLESLDIDSLGATELLFTIEDEFAVHLTKEPANLTNVADVVAFIDGLIAATRQHDAGEPNRATSGS